MHCSVTCLFQNKHDGRKTSRVIIFFTDRYLIAPALLSFFVNKPRTCRLDDSLDSTERLRTSFLRHGARDGMEWRMTATPRLHDHGTPRFAPFQAYYIAHVKGEMAIVSIRSMGRSRLTADHVKISSRGPTGTRVWRARYFHHYQPGDDNPRINPNLQIMNCHIGYPLLVVSR